MCVWGGGAFKHILLVVIRFHTVNVSNQKGAHFNIRLSLLNTSTVCGMESRFVLIKTLAIVCLIPFQIIMDLVWKTFVVFRMNFDKEYFVFKNVLSNLHLLIQPWPH